MPVRTRQLVSTSSVPNGATGSVYTALSGHTVILKDVHGWNTNNTATEIIVEIWTSPTSVRTVIRQAVAAGASFSFTGLFIVFREGNELHVRRGTGTLSVVASGANLEGLAD